MSSLFIQFLYNLYAPSPHSLSLSQRNQCSPIVIGHDICEQTVENFSEKLLTKEVQIFAKILFENRPLST